MQNLRNHHARGRRRGFTLIELLIAAMITAMTLAAAATMVSAVSNAALDTKAARNEKKAGRMLVERLAERIRTARGIGEVRPDAIALWESDKNGDDTVNLHETSIITYESSTGEIQRTVTTGATADDVGPAVPVATFTDLAALQTLAGGYTTESVVLGENVDSFTMSGYPSATETRVVNFSFETTGDVENHAFRESVAPRATADYLFEPLANLEPEEPGMPVRRKEVSRWTGWSDIRGDTVLYP